MNISFIGLGTMGLPMANCLANSFMVSGWDASDTQRQKFENSRDTPAESLSHCDVAVTMLPEGDHVTDVYNNHVFPTVK